MYEQDEEATVIRKGNRTLLTDKQTRRAGHEEDLDQDSPTKSIAKRSLATTKLRSLQEKNNLGLTEKQYAKNTMKMSQTEADFFQDFKKLELLEKEKGIKFFECVGDPPMTDEFQENISVKRQNYI